MTVWERLISILTRRPDRPAITEMAMLSEDINRELVYLGMKYMYPALFDHYQAYHYCTSASWRKVIQYVNRVFKFPEYVPARKDCDDFAILFKGLVSACFGLNACAIAVGTSPAGGHAFNMVRTEDGWCIIEPQDGASAELWPLIGDHGYVPSYVLL